MSYKKAMKHSIRKSKKQSNMYFGFHTGISTNETPLYRQVLNNRLEISRWFRSRHDNNPAYTRECIRESIQRLRLTLTKKDIKQ